MSPDFRRRVMMFRSSRSAMASLIVVVGLLLAGLGAELISNSAPVIAHINGKTIFPAYVNYERDVLGLEGAGTIDYRELRPQFSWSVWPVLKWDPVEIDSEQMEYLSPPSISHLMGTDAAGRDVFARLLYGTRISLLFGIGYWLVTYVIGIVLGLMQGFFGGWFDLIGQRLIEIFSAIPVMMLLLFIVSVASPNPVLLCLFLCIFGWMGICQYMRTEALRNRNLTFTEAATSLGASKSRLLFSHILPNSLVPIITFSPYAVIGGIESLATLDFLGFGVPPPTPSWGELLDQARTNYQVAWWLAVFPSVFLFITILCLNFVGEAVRKAFDPRS
ncbi:MAG: ABC transporter permease subunit [Proteobacteria bacterium]|nr:ABC transporter permease subunit [Pseudomonadota bacterium]